MNLNKRLPEFCIMSLFIIFILISLTLSVSAFENNIEVVPDLPDLIKIFTEDRAVMSRTFYLPFNENHYLRWKKFYSEWENRLSKINFDKLDTDNRIDFLLLKNCILYEKSSLEIEKERNDAIKSYLPFAEQILTLEENRRSMKSVKAGECADILSDVSKEVNKLIGDIRTDEMQLYIAKRISAMVSRLQRILKHWYDFYHAYDPLFTWWMEKPFEKVNKSLSDFKEVLDKKYRGNPDDDYPPVVGYPIGREALINELENSMIKYTPEELIEAGKREYDWCEKEMIKASKELGYGEDWLKALEYVKTLHVEPGKQPSLIRELALEAIDFVEKKDLLTVPQLAKDTWKIEMMSPRRQLVNPFFTGGEVISVSFPTNTMTHEQKLMSMRGNNRHFARATVHHELIPGHHLQMFMMPRYKPYRRIFGTPFWLEGWALHWEMLLWDLGFAKSPENRIGMLFWKMHRCARIVFSLSYHLGLMTPQECIDMLVERVGHERANAVAEVRRSFEENYPPLYQCAYLLGGLQMRKLYRECTESGKYTPKEFHDAVLKENSIPIVLLRAKLLNSNIKKDFSAEWKFLR